MKITNEDIGRRIWSYAAQQWFTVVDYTARQSHPVMIEVQNGDRFAIRSDGCCNWGDAAPVFFWREIKPIEHEERPKKIIKKQRGVVLCRDHDSDIVETRNLYTKEEFEREHGENLKFLCFAPDRKIVEVEEEVEE